MAEGTGVAVRRRMHPFTGVGFAVLALALLWWFAYYGQWHGPFGLLDIKLGCLSGDASECASFREFIGPSPIPVYMSGIWWVGLVCLVAGMLLNRRTKA